MFGRRSIETITAHVASDRFFSGELLLVDVRTRREYEQVRVPRAVHIPLQEVRGRLGELRTDHPVAFLCRTGHRSAAATRLAAGQRPDVFNVAGGMNAWRAAGLPTADCPTTTRRCPS